MQFYPDGPSALFLGLGLALTLTPTDRRAEDVAEAGAGIGRAELDHRLLLLVDLARHGDLRFDCVISAELAHVYKPDPEVYLTAARLLGVEPAELMLVASHPWDLKGARRAGLRTALVDRPLEYGPGSDAREDPDADESVGDLLELADRLGDLPG